MRHVQTFCSDALSPGTSEALYLAAPVASTDDADAWLSCSVVETPCFASHPRGARPICHCLHLMAPWPTVSFHLYADDLRRGYAYDVVQAPQIVLCLETATGSGKLAVKALGRQEGFGAVF